MLLTRFEVTEKESAFNGKTFEIHGNVFIEKDIDGNRYPEFQDITLMLLCDDVYREYIPEGCDWYGHRYHAEDIMRSVFSQSCLLNNNYQIEYWHPELDAILKEYTSDAALTVNNIDIPRRVISPCGDIFHVMHVTDQFIYYSREEQILMLSTSTHNVLSDNCFAENAWLESMEHVLNGTETLLYGEKPKKEWF